MASLRDMEHQGAEANIRNVSYAFSTSAKLKATARCQLHYMTDPASPEVLKINVCLAAVNVPGVKTFRQR